MDTLQKSNARISLCRCSPEEGLDARDLSKFLRQFDGLIKEVAKSRAPLEKRDYKSASL